MNEFFSQLKKDAETLKLSKLEKETMLKRLKAEMQRLPMTKSPLAPVPSPYFSFVVPRALIFAVLVLVVVGGGSAYAAEGAVPGEFLYTIKVGLNEPVRAALATSVEAKASWHAEAAERRMQEAEVLSANGALTIDVKTELESRFEAHAAQVEDTIAEVQEDDPVLAADITARFESALAAHSALIARLSVNSTDQESRRESEDFARTLKDRERKLAMAEESVSETTHDTSGAIALRTFTAQEATTLSASVEIQDGNSAVVERLGINASSALEEAKQRFEAIRGRLSTSTSARLEAQIDDVQKQIERSRGESSQKRMIERAFKNAATIRAFVEAEEKFEGRALLPGLDVADDEEPGHEEEDGNMELVKPLPL